MINEVFRLSGLAALLIAGGCGPHLAVGPMQTEPFAVPLGPAERANVELDMQGGEMELSSDATQLVEGSAEFNVPAFKPQLEVSRIGSRSSITIRQPDRGPHSGGPNIRNRWKLALNPHVLTDLTLNCGAGRFRLMLGALTLRHLEVHLGVGQVDVDLRGKPRRDYDVVINGGVGQATVHLPAQAGLRAEAHGAIGNVQVTGLEKRGDHYENELFGKGPVDIDVKVDGAIGQIQVAAE